LTENRIRARSRSCAHRPSAQTVSTTSCALIMGHTIFKMDTRGPLGPVSGPLGRSTALDCRGPQGRTQRRLRMYVHAGRSTLVFFCTRPPKPKPKTKARKCAREKVHICGSGSVCSRTCVFHHMDPLGQSIGFSPAQRRVLRCQHTGVCCVHALSPMDSVTCRSMKGAPIVHTQHAFACTGRILML
jgi:hypothetical protein